MSLRSCVSCGATLTDMFRFCPACGLSNEEDSMWGGEPKAPLSFPVVARESRPRRAREPQPTWWTRTVRNVAAVRLPSTAPVRGRVRRRVAVVPRSIGSRTRRMFAAWGEAAGLMVEVVVLSLGAARDGLRSMVLVRKLHAQRAAVIYSTGCAALNGDDYRVRHARTEVQVLDELITAAATGVLADVPTQETVRR